MLSRRTLLASIFISSLLGAGCIRQVVQTLSEIKVVHDELVKKFGEEVNVHVNFGAHDRLFLYVTFVNSPLNQQPPELRAKRAQETADIVKARYPRINSVDSIWIMFISQTTRMIVFHKSEVLSSFLFDKNAQALRAPAPNAAYGPGPAVTYQPDSKESDVAVNGLQLEGTPGGMGLTVLPHFKAAGDARTGKLTTPKEVSFDIASYSENEKFTGSVPIVFVVDGKTLLQAKRTFSTTRSGDTVSQFCYLSVPYHAFQRIVSGKYLIIKLADAEYYLDREQFGALQRMDDYIDHR